MTEPEATAVLLDSLWIMLGRVRFVEVITETVPAPLEGLAPAAFSARRAALEALRSISDVTRHATSGCPATT